MSSNDPPLPPTPGEPSDDPPWGSGDDNSEGSGPETPDESGGAGAEGEPADNLETSGEVPATEPLPETEAETAGSPETVDAAEPGAETAAAATDPLLETEAAATEQLPETVAETEVLPEAAAATAVMAETEYVEPTPSAAHRRRVSHRRYVMRRIGVAAGLLAVIGGAIALLVWAVGDDDGGEAGSISTTVAGAAPASSAPPAVAESTEPATMTTLAAELVDTTEATEDAAGSPTTEAADGGQGVVDDTEPSTETSAPDGDDEPEATTETSTPGESAPPGTVVYDLDSEASCGIGQTLQRGDTGPQVECLQERLNEVTVGGEPANVDGVFGEQTEVAVRRFQEANDLLVDGIVGPTTGELLGIWPNGTA